MSKPPVTVLVVDDSADTREMLRAFLESEGLAVLEADSVDAATRVLDGDRAIACVLTDYHMPGGHGLLLVAVVRARHPRLPVVVVSCDDAVREASLRAGAAAFMPKPCGASELGRALRPLLAQ